MAESTGPISPPRAWRVTAIAIAVVGGVLAVSLVTQGILRLGGWSGDAIVHLAMADRAAHAGWFELNPGEPVAAETSFGWLAIETLLVRLGGMHFAVHAVPFVDVAAFVGTGMLAYRLARRAGGERAGAVLGALAATGLPGVAFNAALGMESMAFAAAVLGFLACLTSRGRASNGAICGTVLAAACIVRPEGLLLAVLPALDGIHGHRRRRAIAVLGVALALVTPVLLFQLTRTHALVATSATSRIEMARQRIDSVHVLGPIWIYGATLLRMLAYGPLTLLAVLAAGMRLPGSDEGHAARRALAMSAGLGVVAYTIVAGSAHVARHTTWLFALLATLAPAGARCMSVLTRRQWPQVALAVAFAATATGEMLMRSAGQAIPSASLLAGWDERAPRTDALLAAVCAGGCCRAGAVPRVLATEIEERMSLDGRVAIASADGRAGPEVRFDERGCPDVEAELADPRIVGILDPPYASRPGCPQGGLSGAIETAWAGRGPWPEGWHLDAASDVAVRDCALVR
jgi:hypothetical protein